MFNRVQPSHTFTLTVQRPHAGVVTAGIVATKNHSPTNQPIRSLADGWTRVLETAVQAAFLGRDVTFLLGEPPLEWSDVDLTQLAADIVPTSAANPDYHMAYAPQVGEAALRHAAQSEDFLHGALLIAALPPRNDTAFMAALRHVAAQYPDQRTYEQLSPDDLRVLFERETEQKAAAGVEFMECDYDGDNLYWYQPSSSALAACLAAWQQVATAEGWQFQSL